MRREGAEEIDARRPGRGGEIADGERAPRWVTLAQNLDDRIVEEAQTAVTGQLPDAVRHARVPRETVVLDAPQSGAAFLWCVGAGDILH